MTFILSIKFHENLFIGLRWVASVVYCCYHRAFPLIWQWTEWWKVSRQRFFSVCRLAGKPHKFNFNIKNYLNQINLLLLVFPAVEPGSYFSSIIMSSHQKKANNFSQKCTKINWMIKKILCHSFDNITNTSFFLKSITPLPNHTSYFAV